MAIGSSLETKPISRDGCTIRGPQNSQQELENEEQKGEAVESINSRFRDIENSSVPPESATCDYTQCYSEFCLTVRGIFAKVTWRDLIFFLVGFLASLIVMVIAFVIYTLKGSSCELQGATSSPPVVTSTPPFPWKINGTWKYHFSETEATWDESWRNCSFYGASLLSLDTLEERVFIEDAKIIQDSWIDLRRESPGGAWKYSDGADFDNSFEISNHEGLCAYWNKHVISSTSCNQNRYYICRMELLKQ